MKKTEIVALIIIGLLFVMTYVLTMEFKKESQLKQSEIDGLRAANVKERDSLESQLAATKDSLTIAFETIRQAKEETLKANEASQREIKKLKGILFVQHTDSSRTAELKQLYKSYTP